MPRSRLSNSGTASGTRRGHGPFPIPPHLQRSLSSVSHGTSGSGLSIGEDLLDGIVTPEPGRGHGPLASGELSSPGLDAQPPQPLSKSRARSYSNTSEMIAFSLGLPWREDQGDEDHNAGDDAVDERRGHGDFSHGGTSGHTHGGTSSNHGNHDGDVDLDAEAVDWRHEHSMGLPLGQDQAHDAAAASGAMASSSSHARHTASTAPVPRAEFVPDRDDLHQYGLDSRRLEEELAGTVGGRVVLMPPQHPLTTTVRVVPPYVAHETDADAAVASPTAASTQPSAPQPAQQLPRHTAQQVEALERYVARLETALLQHTRKSMVAQNNLQSKRYDPIGRVLANRRMERYRTPAPEVLVRVLALCSRV